MATITYLTTIHFDFGALALLPGELKRLGVTCPLVVTDRGVASAGLLARVLEAIGSGFNAQVWDGTPANPTEDAVMAAAQVYRDRGCDGLVAVGGGSSIDLAKAVGLIATHSEPLMQYAAVEGGCADHVPSRTADRGANDRRHR